jgi:hypothetical protein
MPVVVVRARAGLTSFGMGYLVDEIGERVAAGPVGFMVYA